MLTWKLAGCGSPRTPILICNLLDSFSLHLFFVVCLVLLPFSTTRVCPLNSLLFSCVCFFFRLC
jgi:hypothetical protein